MGTTGNNSWPYPESSDYVADGATAIQNLADAIDADLDTTLLKVDSASSRVGINDVTPSYTLDVAGIINAQTGLKINGKSVGEWTSFAPGFSGLTLGASGAAVGRYAEVGDLVFYNVKFDLGGTGSVVGHVTLTTPLGSADTSTTFATSHIGWVRPTGATIYHCMGFSSGTNIPFYGYVTSSTYSNATAINATIPDTWTSNGLGYFAGWYSR